MVKDELRIGTPHTMETRVNDQDKILVTRGAKLVK